MKLSEAMRLGEFALPAVHGSWIDLDKNGKPCGACAVGRACIAAGVKVNESVRGEYDACMEFMDQTWPWTQRTTLEMPENSRFPSMFEAWNAYGVKYNAVMQCVSDLYEYYGWSMQQLADLVESIEPKEDVCTTTLTTPNSSTCPVA
jgi:hypothetical protein